MRGVLHWTIWQKRWSTLWWTIGISAFIALQLVFYPTFRDQQEQLEKSFKQLPESAVALFTDTGDLFSPIGFLSGQIFYLMLPLIMGALAIALGSSVIGKEEKDGTLELLLSKPISRNKLMITKAFAGLFILIGVGVVASVITAVMAKVVNLPVYFDQVVLAGLVCTFLVICFGAVAFAASVAGRGVRSVAIAIAGVYAIGGYLLTSMSGTVDWLKWPAKLFPFDYYRPAEVLQGNYSWVNLSFFIIVILVAASLSWRFFNRRDIGN